MIPNANADHKLFQPKRVRLHHRDSWQLVLCLITAAIPAVIAQQQPGWRGSMFPASRLKFMTCLMLTNFVRDAGEVTNSYVYIKS